MSKLDEGSALERFGQEIDNHLLCRTILHGQVAIGDTVGNKEIAHVKMSCMLGTQQSAILFEEDGTLIVLMEDGFIHIETLSMDKVVHSK